MKLLIKIGARSASNWRATKRAELIDFPQYEYVGATWFEYAGTGETQRTIRIPYADIPEMIEELSAAHARHIRKERKAQEKAEAQRRKGLTVVRSQGA